MGAPLCGGDIGCEYCGPKVGEYWHAEDGDGKIKRCLILKTNRDECLISFRKYQYKWMNINHVHSKWYPNLFWRMWGYK